MQGHKYALLLVDDYTSYTWIYFLECKAQAQDAIRSFILQQHNAGNRIHKIRSDNGGEFMSGLLQEFFLQQGIIHARSPPYTPQYKGKVERLNGTIGEMAHAMRVGAGLSTI